MEKQFMYDDKIIEAFQNLLESKELKINGIKDLNAKELVTFGVKIGLSHEKKSSELIKIDLINLSKILLGGQVNFFHLKITLKRN